MNELSKLRISRITYTNVWPIFHFFDPSRFSDEIELIPQVPSQLNRQMAEGKIDIGPISSFAYAEHANDYVLLPNLSVSAYGKVGSINLFLKKDLRSAANSKIALTNTSATSVNLLKIILEGFIGGRPEYLTMEPKLDEMMKVADGALLIGDEALLACWENEHKNHYTMIDLGNEWLERTNRWMTFAVWAVRKEILDSEPELLYKVYQEFMRSKRMGKEKVDIIIDKSISNYGGTKEFWHQYFSGLTHDFSNDQINGLEYYFKNAEKIGVLKKAPKVEVIDFNQLPLAVK